MFIILLLLSGFTAEPYDVYVTCNTNIKEVLFHCQIDQFTGFPRWFINSVAHSANDHNLQEQYIINRTTLALRMLTPELNNTRYQCQIRLLNSTEGQLIITCPGMKHMKVP